MVWRPENTSVHPYECCHTALSAKPATPLGALAAAPTYPPVPPGHPRVYLRPADLPALRAKSKDRNARRLWQAVTNRASDPVVLAFTGLLNQDASSCGKAVDAMGKVLKKTTSYNGKPTSKEVDLPTTLSAFSSSLDLTSL